MEICNRDTIPYSCDWSHEIYIAHVPIDSSTHYPFIQSDCTAKLLPLPSREVACTISMMVFCMTRPGLEPMTFHMKSGHNDHLVTLMWSYIINQLAFIKHATNDLNRLHNNSVNALIKWTFKSLNHRMTFWILQSYTVQSEWIKSHISNHKNSIKYWEKNWYFGKNMHEESL